jgi:hypothetical protein
MGQGTTPDILLQEGLDAKIDILAKRQRRLILLTLKHDDEKHETDVLFRGGDDMDDAEIQLVHTHLPKLDEADYIEWDRDSGMISEGPRDDEIKPLLDLIENHADELPPDWPWVSERARYRRTDKIWKSLYSASRLFTTPLT